MTDTFTLTSSSDVFALQARMNDYFSRGGRVLVVEIEEGTGKKRSDAQNRYYFGVVVKKALQGYKANNGELVIDVLTALKARLTTDFVHELIKLILGVASTKRKDTKKFEALMTRARMHYAERGWDIPEPNEEQWQAILDEANEKETEQKGA